MTAPSTAAAELVVELAVAREEKRAAAHTIAQIQIGLLDEPAAAAPLFVRRREVELYVAEIRLQLWSEECRRRETAIRLLGVRP